MKRRYLLSVIFLVVIPVVLFTGITAVLNLDFLDTLTSPLLQKLGLLPDLLAGNLLSGLKWLFFETPILAIESIKDAEVTWGLYWSLFNIVVLVVLALFFATKLKAWAEFSRQQKQYLIFAILLCWSVTFELWLIGCCGAGPQWWPEILLLSKAYMSNPYVDTINWQGIYQKLTAISLLLRVSVLAAGLGLFLYTLRKSRRY